jgi:hypothetical protein
VYAKEVGFNDFQKVNQRPLSIHIIFDAGLQRQQEQLFTDLRLNSN